MTRNHVHILAIPAAAAGLMMTSTRSAPAALLAPGANIPAAATLDDPTLGALVATTGPQAFAAATFSGTVVAEVRQETALANPLGGLTFVWEVDSSAASITDIERTTTFSFGGGWTVDATYFVDTVGDQAPVNFTRSGNSTVVGADFGLSAAALNPGDSSTLLVLRTNAPSHQPGIISVINGGTDTVIGYAPIPEPAAAIPLVIGAALLVLSRRPRRRSQHNSTQSEDGNMTCASSSARTLASVAAAVAATYLAATAPLAHATLGGFETADGYSTPFSKDVWSYDAGVTGGPIAPNTGRWTEVLGSGVSVDSQYFNQHGYGGGGANVAPFALVARARTTSTDGTYNQTVRYATGIEDLGVTPSTPLLSANITFDLNPGITVENVGSFQDNTFNDVPAFSISFGGTDPAPGATIGFTDHHPTSGFPVDFFHMNGPTYQSQPFTFTRRFDRVEVDLDFVNSTFDVQITKDFNTSTTDFDPGNSPIVMVTGAPFTTPISLLDALYFRTHHDPGTLGVPAGLEKTFIDNFSIHVQAVPEPSAAVALLTTGAAMLMHRPRRRRQRQA